MCLGRPSLWCRNISNFYSGLQYMAPDFIFIPLSLFKIPPIVHCSWKVFKKRLCSEMQISPSVQLWLWSCCLYCTLNDFLMSVFGRHTDNRINIWGNADLLVLCILIVCQQLLTGKWLIHPSTCLSIIWSALTLCSLSSPDPISILITTHTYAHSLREHLSLANAAKKIMPLWGAF